MMHPSIRQASITVGALVLPAIWPSFEPASGFVALPAPASTGLQIELVYQSGRSDPPSWDPGGAKLTATMEYAAAVWERIFADVPSTTIKVRYRWEDIDDSLLAVRRSGIYPTILFDPVRDSGAERNWFYDFDPEEHSEFAMTQVTASGDPNASTYYSGSMAVPRWFEVSYNGNAQASPGVPAPSGTDLLTVALHEMAHQLGMRGSDPYLVPSDYFAHKVCGLGTFNIRPGTCTTDGHVRPPSLMQCGLGPGQRYLPTANDILALARENGWTTLGDVNLPQKELLPACDGSYGPNLAWGNGRNWFGGRAPDAYTNAFVREGGTVGYLYLTGLSDCLNLQVSNRRNVQTRGHQLRIGEDLDVFDVDTVFEVNSGSAVGMRDLFMSGSTLIAYEGTYVFASRDGYVGGSAAEIQLRGVGGAGGAHAIVEVRDTLQIDQGARVTMSHARLIPDTLVLTDDGRLRGFGEVLAVDEVSNGGTIEAQNSWLDFWPEAPTSTFDLDGETEPGVGEVGELEAISGSIRFRGGVFEEFDGRMTIAELQSIVFEAVRFDLGADGVVAFQDYAPGAEAWLAAESMRLVGAVEVGASVDANVSASTIEVQPGTFWSVGGRLALRGRTRYLGTEGGALAGGGTLAQLGNVEVVGGTFESPTTTVIGVNSYDWDGKSVAGGTPSGHVTEVMPFARFRIAGDVFGRFEGSVDVSPAAELRLDEPWALGPTGSARLQAFPHPAAMPTMLADEFENHGTVHVSGYAGIPGGTALIGGEGTDVSAGALRCCEFVNHGTIRVEDGSVLIVLGDVENLGSIDATSGAVMVLGYVTGGGSTSGLVIDRSVWPTLPSCP